MKLELETKNRTVGLEIDIELLKHKFKKFFKNLLGAIGIIAMCLMCCIEVKDDVSVFTTALIYLSLLAVFTLGMIVNND